MKTLDELARERLTRWMNANPDVTQTAIGKAIGHTQGWVSAYKSGSQQADLDELSGMAGMFGHTIFELLDLRQSPKEAALLEVFREIEEGRRDFAIEMLRQIVVPQPKRARTR